MNNLVCFCIDLDSRKPEVMEFSGEELKFDLDFFGVKTPKELENFDRRIFMKEAEAENFLHDYKKTLASWENQKTCQDRRLPAMLLKRRYLVQTLMGHKSFTCRDYRKNWMSGQLFNFHDQVYFLTVQLINIEECHDDDGVFYKYHFELPKRSIM